MQPLCLYGPNERKHDVRSPSATVSVLRTLIGAAVCFLPQFASAQTCDNLWNIRYFGCDVGCCNDFVLQRNGTPACGSRNCSGPPGSCWGPVHTTRSFSSGAISWDVSDAGSLILTHDRDMQAYGETYVYVNSQGGTDINVGYSSDRGEVWLNNQDITASKSGGALPMHLQYGWNHIEWTSYNQNQGTHFNLQFPFAESGRVMRCMPECRNDFNGDGQLNSSDVFDFLDALFMLDLSADVNHDGVLNSQDFFDYIASFFSGCS